MTSSKPLLLQLLALPILPDAQERLNRHFNVVKVWEQADAHATIAAHQNGVCVLVTGGRTIDAALMDAMPRLKAICNLGVGYDAIDVKYAQSKGIQVSNTPDVLNDCVADLTWGLILATARSMGQAERHLRAGQWGTSASLPLGVKVTGKKLGIVGLGRIGQAIAARSTGFQMNVRYHNRHARTDVCWDYEKSLNNLAAWADILVIATVGGSSTHRLINRDVLEALGPQGILINISRGSVIDEAALVQALLDGKLGAAGLDVFEAEPQVPDALKRLDNVVLLPHIASATLETRQAMANLVIENAEAFAETGRVKTPIPAL